MGRLGFDARPWYLDANIRCSMIGLDALSSASMLLNPNRVIAEDVKCLPTADISDGRH